MEDKNNNSKLRAVDYARTSGPNYTSLGSQTEANVKFINDNGWQYVGHYEDENLSGAKVEGRDDFQRMMKDATKDQFDIIVPYDITRFARDGCDIIYNAKFLKSTFGIYVVDTKGLFDSRDYRKTSLNYQQAGEAEAERLRILDRTINRGRKPTAAAGKRYCGNAPLGREWDGEKYVISEYGKKLQKALPRYAAGEAWRDLAIEFGLRNIKAITRAIRKGQLSGTYYAVFNAPDIGIIEEKVAVPGMPEIVTPATGKRLKDRLAHNTRWTKQSKKKYLLSGFVRCTQDGRALKAQTQTSGQGNSSKKIVYYRHYYKNYYADGRDKQNKCTAFRGIRGDLLESSVLDYLYSFFLDKPAFKQAVNNTIPSQADRKALKQDIKGIDKQLKQLDQEELKLFNAWGDGMKKTKVSIDRQNEIIKQREVKQIIRNDLQQTLDAQPNPEVMKQDAKILRWQLMSRHWGKDWRQLPYDEVRRFLHYLFGDNPKKKGYGIFVGKQNNQWVITFKGCIEFYHDVVDGKPKFSSRLTQEEIDSLTAKLEQKQKDKKRVDKLVARVDKGRKELETITQMIEDVKKYQAIISASDRKIRKANKLLTKLSGTSNIKPDTPNS